MPSEKVLLLFLCPFLKRSDKYLSSAPVKKLSRRIIELAPHPEACPIEEVVSRYSACDKPLALDLFSGCGGLSLGLHRAGFEVILGVDIKPDEHTIRPQRLSKQARMARKPDGCIDDDIAWLNI